MPRDERAEKYYFIVILNRQFMAEPANARLSGQAFFDRSPLGGEMVRQYHIRCFESAAEHWMQPSA